MVNQYINIPRVCSEINDVKCNLSTRFITHLLTNKSGSTLVVFPARVSLVTKSSAIHVKQRARRSLSLFRHNRALNTISSGVNIDTFKKFIECIE